MNMYHLLITISIAGILTSCQTTGDPSAGGIFWSEKNAQQRLDQKQSELDRLQNKTKAAHEATQAREKTIRSLD